MGKITAPSCSSITSASWRVTTFRRCHVDLPELKTLRCEGSDVGCYMGKLHFRNCSLSDLETDSGFFSNVWDLKCGRHSFDLSQTDHSLFTNYIQETSPLLDIFKPTDHFDYLQSDATEISLLSSEGNAEDVTRVDFSPFHNVRSIFIESYSLINVTSFTVKSLPFLRALSTDKQVCTKKGVAASLSIEDCPALYKVHFHDRSFRDFTSFTLRACPKLQYLECGKRCFKRAREFHLKSLRLKSVPRRFAGAEASEAGVQVIHEGLGCRAGE